MNDDQYACFDELERQIATFPRVILTHEQLDCLKALVDYKHDGWDYEVLWIGNGRWNTALKKRDAEALRDQILRVVADKVATQLTGNTQ